MASVVRIELKGFRELGDRLKALGPDVARNGLRTADFAGAKIIRDAAKETVPVKTGLLQAQIYASRRRTPENVAKYTVIVKKKAKFLLIARRADTAKNRKKGRVGKYHQIAGPNVYGRFIEFGTSKMAARPFLRPATLNNVNNAIEAIRSGLQKAIDRAVKRR